MKKSLMCLLSLISTLSVAVASDNFTYTATAAPGNTPDGIDQNSTSVNVWQVTLSATGGRETEYSLGGGLTNAWEEYTSLSGTPDVNGTVDATTTFAGGDLAIGQTVSIVFLNNSIYDANGSVGFSLMDGSISEITFAYIGDKYGEYYAYTDGSVSEHQIGSGANSIPVDLSFTLTSATTYSATAYDEYVDASWNGTYSGSISGVDVFNHGGALVEGGSGTEVLFNDLSVVPEPSTWAMLGIGGVALLGYRRGFKATV
jgi:hypothetical protein